MSHWIAVGLAALLAVAATSARAADPRLPPGRDRGGPVVAIVSEGIDYTDAGIEPRLARDGEGELIGWDFVDGDNRPYAKGPESRAAALALEVMPQARIIPLRAAPSEPSTFAAAVLFAARTPARAVILSVVPAQTKGWQELERAARDSDGLHIGLLSCAIPGGTAPPDSFAALSNVRVIPCP